MSRVQRAPQQRRDQGPRTTPLISRRLIGLVALLSLLLALAPPAAAAADRQGRVTPSDPFTWSGTQATGANTDYVGRDGGPCGKTPADYCDTTLVHVDVPASFWEERAGGARFRIFGYSPNAGSDFDVFIYESNSEGDRGRLAGSSTAPAGVEEATTIEEASGYYLVHVVYFAVTQSQYQGETRLVLRKRFPPDVDRPPGSQDILVSDPTSGYRSHSELHLDQSPVDRNLLIGGSKFYNKDPDSLAEYEFKVGTYVSFDGGKAWTDLGPARVCPAPEAPPGSWPLENTCYPAEDPQREGTGGEDENDPRARGDYGEEYITSDPWVQFDDEGNAYLMVLDHPPFEGTENGWGMTFHRWETVSTADLRAGETWGPRIPINAYATEQERQELLDDKNTFAVNNAGPDLDGVVGTMVACWGQSVRSLVKQQIVCERSTDGGKTWPGRPQPISGQEQLVIGVHVVADPQDENTFYATWLQYATGLAGPSTLDFAMSADGGSTWTPPRPIAEVSDLPRRFPGQNFRNSTLPIMAAGPSGELYIVYSEYREAPAPDSDQDGMQADIMMLKSTDGGVSFEAPVKVNNDETNADQFQPYVAVTQTGQVLVSFFDRRNDRPILRGDILEHPGNFFIDEYLAISSDGGATFEEIRLSHDLWDPTINAPVSPSGGFIGDYQGLVANTCRAVPFFNNTHLANQEQDRRFDARHPDSRFQEAFAYVVKNRLRYAGPAADRMTGGAGHDELCGFGGKDKLAGRRGNDILKGGPEDDVLVGGPGRDRCTGGGGRDRFRGCEKIWRD